MDYIAPCNSCIFQSTSEFCLQLWVAVFLDEAVATQNCAQSNQMKSTQNQARMYPDLPKPG